MTTLKRLAPVVALILALAGCGGDDEASEPAAERPAAKEFAADTTMGRIQQKGELVIGVKYDVPPFGFKNPQSGDVEGFDIDMGQAVADALGVKPKFVEAISDNRIPSSRTGPSTSCCRR